MYIFPLDEYIIPASTPPTVTSGRLACYEGGDYSYHKLCQQEQCKKIGDSLSKAIKEAKDYNKFHTERESFSNHDFLKKQYFPKAKVNDMLVLRSFKIAQTFSVFDVTGQEQKVNSDESEAPFSDESEVPFSDKAEVSFPGEEDVELSLIHI